MLKLSLILSCLFALPLASMDDNRWAWIAELLTAEDDQIDYQEPNLGHSDAQELQQYDDMEPFDPQKFNSWADELLSNNSLVQIADTLTENDQIDYQQQNIFFDETQEPNLGHSDAQEPQQYNNTDAFDTQKIYYWPDNILSNNSLVQIPDESDGNGQISQTIDQPQTQHEPTQAMSQTQNESELQMQMDQLQSMSQAHNWPEQTQANQTQTLSEQRPTINQPRHGQGFRPAMNQNGRGRGNRPMMNQNGFGRGNVPVMNQNGFGRGNVPVMNQNGFGRGNVLVMNQNGFRGRNIPAMNQNGRGRGAHQDIKAHEQYAPIIVQPQLMPHADPAPVPQPAPQGVATFDSIATRAPQVHDEEHFFQSALKVFQKELNLCRRDGSYLTEPWANEEKAKIFVQKCLALNIATKYEEDVTQVGKHWFPALAKKNSVVERITFIVTEMSAATFNSFLDVLGPNSKLTTLELKIGTLTDDNLLNLSLALRSSKIQHILIESMKFTKRGVLFLINIAKDINAKEQILKTITIQNLSGKPIPKAFIPVLQQEAGLEKLTISYLPEDNAPIDEKKRKTK